MRSAIVLAVLGLAGCPRGGSKAPGGDGRGSAAGSATGSGTGTTRPPVVSGQPLLDPAGVPCASASCAYHEGSATYAVCLTGGDGACFHWGAICEPSDACMFDATKRAYRACAQAAGGQCARFGAACAPVRNCWFDPTDGRHRVCDRASADGTCATYGATCAP